MTVPVVLVHGSVIRFSWHSSMSWQVSLLAVTKEASAGRTDWTTSAPGTRRSARSTIGPVFEVVQLPLSAPSARSHHGRRASANPDAKGPAGEDIGRPMHAKIDETQAECDYGGRKYHTGQPPASRAQPDQADIEGCRDSGRESRIGRRHRQTARVDECHRCRWAPSTQDRFEQSGDQRRGDNGNRHADSESVPLAGDDVDEAEKSGDGEDDQVGAEGHDPVSQLIPNREAIGSDPAPQSRVEPSYRVTIGECSSGSRA